MIHIGPDGGTSLIRPDVIVGHYEVGVSMAAISLYQSVRSTEPA